MNINKDTSIDSLHSIRKLIKELFAIVPWRQHHRDEFITPAAENINNERNVNIYHCLSTVLINVLLYFKHLQKGRKITAKNI